MTSLSDAGEIEIIKQICSLLDQKEDVICGPGDDCAVVRINDLAGLDLILTSDPVTDQIHFSNDASPENIGHKALARSLSDIAAMGAKPAWSLCNITAPPSTDTAVIEGISAGMKALADVFSVSITGGDVSESPVLSAHVFTVGTVPSGKAVLRSTAGPGDRIYVTGQLGGSILGRHLSFMPRVSEGLMLNKWATSMIDISDGLASDLKHLGDASGTGAVIYAKDIPISSAASAINDGVAELNHALFDGEDFELLFTVPDEKKKEFEQSWNKTFDLQLSCIGYMTDCKDMLEIVNSGGTTGKLEIKGYEHFGR